MSLRRFTAIVRKEMLHIVRDVRTLFLVTLAPAFLLFLFAYIFSFDVGQLRLAVLDLDRTSLSRRYVASLASDPDFALASAVGHYGESVPLLLAGDADAILIIPLGFADTVGGGKPVQVQAVLDGADPLAANQAMGSMEAKSAVFVASNNGAGGEGGAELVEVRASAWYNAGGESLWSMVPGLVAIVLLMPTMAFALALAREKETGTLEGLIATPVSGLEYLLGKLVAYIIPGLVSATLVLLVAILWFEVPFRGSLPLYLIMVAIYFMACMGASTVIANFVRSQQTAMFIVLLVFLVPSFFLAGLITPVSTESLDSMLTSYAMPSTHFVEISRVVFLKGLGLEYVARPALALLVMGAGALGVGLWLFRKRIA
jgi:ABC-2 type transport system permease protein